MNDMKHWFVLSGGPATGKTTMLTMLAKRGYAVVSETARAHIEAELAHGRSLERIQSDPRAFQTEVLCRQEDAERAAPPGVVIFDRGIPDIRAYYRFHGIPEDPALTEAIHHASYERVFLLDPLPMTTDHARVESRAEQLEICHLIHEVYDELPFPTTHIPVLPMEERCALIQSFLPPPTHAEDIL